MFKLNYKLLHPYYYPTDHTQARVDSAGPVYNVLATMLAAEKQGGIVVNCKDSGVRRHEFFHHHFSMSLGK